MSESLQEFGYSVTRAESGVGSPASIRSLLLEVWKALAPSPAPEDVPPWVQRAGSLTTGYITSQLRDLATEERLGIVLTDIDLLEPLTPYEVIALSELAAATQWIIVVTSNRDSNSPWQVLGQADRRLALRDFSYDDVVMCLQNAPELRERRAAELERAAQSVVAASAGPIRPSVAYTVLKAWSTGGN